MQIMQSREETLWSTIDGYEASRVNLIWLVRANEALFGPAGRGDDAGLYYFVPWVARTLGVGLHAALDVFFFSLLIAAALSACLAFCVWFRRWEVRLLAATCVVGLLNQLVNHADVYLIAPALALGLLPWGVLFFRSDRWRILFLGFAASAGLLIGYANLVRTHAGTGTLIFLVVLALGSRPRPWRERVAFCGLLLAGMLAAQAHFAVLFHERDRFLEATASRPLALPDGCTVRTAQVPEHRSHPVWHSVYIGFGFLHNSHDIHYDDGCAWKRVRELQPQTPYLSREYEQILKNEVLRLWTSDPNFVSRTLAAKCGVVGWYLLRTAWLGLLLAFFLPSTLFVDVGFLLTATFYALPGIIVMPIEEYVLGTFATATVFSACKLGQLAELFPRPSWLHRRCWTVARLAVAAGLLLLIRGDARAAYHTVRSTNDLSQRLDKKEPIVRMIANMSPTRIHHIPAQDWHSPRANKVERLGEAALSLATTATSWAPELKAPLDMTGDEVAARVLIELQVLEGGATVSVVDETGAWSDMCIVAGTGTYSRTLIAPAAKQNTLALIVANHRPEGGCSRVILRKTRLEFFGLPAR